MQNQIDCDTNRYLQVLDTLEQLILDHFQSPLNSTLRRLVPSVGRMFTPLPLRQAFLELDRDRSISVRRFIAPSFNDIRHLLNKAQVAASSSVVKLVTFDGDCTLYKDGANFSDSVLISQFLILLTKQSVAVVTAAGYGQEPARYEERLVGLLDAMKSSSLAPEQLERFYVLGGECHYLFKYSHPAQRLVYIPHAEYQSPSVQQWSMDVAGMDALLNIAHAELTKCAERLGLTDDVSLLRKSRAVGLVALRPLSREQLDEFCLATKHALDSSNLQIPFCCFNGGSDVWVDIGNKMIGVELLCSYLKLFPDGCLHVGDQFLGTGNDLATRSGCCTVWITNPQETIGVLKDLIKQI